MIKPPMRHLMPLGIAAVLAWLGATPAGAAPTSWTVTNPNSDGTYTVADAELTLRNTNTGDTITCADPQSTNGELKSGTYDPDPRVEGANVGWVRTDHPDCTDAHGTEVTVVQIEQSFYAESYDHAAGRTTGAMRPRLWTLFWVERPGCNYYVGDPFDVPPEFSYSNSTSALTIDAGSLTLLGLSGTGCDDVAHDGDIMTMSGTYTLTPAITIVGP